MVVIKAPRPTSASVVQLARKNPTSNRPLTAGTFKASGVSIWLLYTRQIHATFFRLFNSSSSQSIVQG